MMLPEATPPQEAMLTPRRPRQQAAADDSKDSVTPTIEKLSSDDTDSSSPLKLTSAPSKEEKEFHMKGNVNNCIPEERRKKIEKRLHTVQKRLPGAKKMMDVVNLLPPRVRVCLVSMWLLWKIFLAVMFLQVVLFTTNQFSESSSQEVTTTTVRRFAQEIDNSNSPGFATTPRILYVVTTLAEFNNGLRQTVRGQDRLGEVLIPILVDSVESMVHPPYNFHVDVYIIAAFELKPEREEYIRQRLPDGVGLEVWDDACRKYY
jgi:hypothetical protein